MRINLGIRAWLALLVLVAVMPGMVVVVHGHFAAKEGELAAARAELKAVATLAAATQARVVEGVRQVLTSVAAGPSVRRDDLFDLCVEYLRNIGQASPGYGNIGVVDLNGDVRCQSDPRNVAFNLSDRQYFHSAVNDRRFSVGEYVLGKVTGRPHIGFGMPVYDYAGALRGVAFAAIDLEKANQRLQALALPRHLQVVVVDGAGIVFLSSAAAEQRIGSPVADAGLAAALRTQGGGPFDIIDARGTPWLHEIMAVADVGSTGLYVVASARRDEALAVAGQRLTRDVSVLVASTAVGLLLAWLLAVRQIATPVSELLQRMRDAALDKPVTPRAAPSTSLELGELERGLDAMLHRLHDSQQQLVRAQQVARVGFFQLDLQTGLYTASATVYEMLGLDPEMGPVTLEQYRAMIHPVDRDQVLAQRERMFAGGPARRLQYRIVRPDGQVRWVDAFGMVDRDAAGAPMSYSGALQDITEQQRLRSLFAVQGQINAAIVKATDAAALFAQACRIAVEDGGMRMSWVATMDEANQVAVPCVQGSADDGDLAPVRNTAIDAQSHAPPVATALRTGELSVCNDIVADDSLGAWRDVAVQHGCRSAAAVPIVVASRPVAALAFMADATHHFQDQERALLQAIGESLSQAMANFRHEEQRRATEGRLKLLEACVSRLNDIVMITEAKPFDEPGPRMLYVNDAFERCTGFSREEAIGRTPRMLQGPNTQRETLARIGAALRRWEPVRAELINYTKAGEEIWLELDIVPVADQVGCYTHCVSIVRDITERKRAEEKEARLNESFRLLFLGNPHPMWVFDPETLGFLEVNAAAIDQYGYSRDEFLAMTIADIRSEDEARRLRMRELDRIPSDSGRDRAGLWRHRRKSGETVIVDITGQRLDYRGRPAELVVAMDMTERVAVERAREQALMALRRSEVRLARAQSLARIGSWERFASDGSAAWSAGLFQLTGRDPALGAPGIDEVMRTVHIDDVAHCRAALQACLGEGRMQRWLYRFVHPDGRVRWFEESSNEPARDDTGAVVSVEGTVQDVTERVDAERSLQMQLARTELLNSITRAIDNRLDMNSIFDAVCESIEQRFAVGFAAAGLCTPPSQDLTLVCIGAQGADLAAATGLASGQRVPAGEGELARCLQGEVVHEPDIGDAPGALPRSLARAGMGSMILAPMQAEGKVFGMLIAARSEPNAFSGGECEFVRQLAEHVALAANQARLHGELRQAYDGLRNAQQQVLQTERLRVIGQMASGIAHDINNAISPAVLYTESLLKREQGLSERGREQLQTIQLAIDDVAETVARMREFYRPNDAGARLRPIDINRVVRQVVDLTRARWRDMPQQSGVSIVLKVELLDALPVVSAVEGELRDALTNLVLNGVDAMPGGGTLLIETARATDEQGQAVVRLAVTDTGIGMDEQTQRRCLEPFFTTKGERGSGLGLAMVAGTVQRHRARMVIESTPGRGTCVRLDFPVAAPGADAARPPVSTAEVAPGAAMKVLVIDDDTMMLRLIGEMLGQEGHAVTTAAGGRLGLEAIDAAITRNTCFDVVITDLRMPEMDGRAVAQAVRERAPATLVVMLSGWGPKMAGEGGRPPGVDHLMSKPPRLAELRAVLALCVQQRRARCDA